VLCDVKISIPHAKNLFQQYRKEEVKMSQLQTRNRRIQKTKDTLHVKEFLAAKKT